MSRDGLFFVHLCCTGPARPMCHRWLAGGRCTMGSTKSIINIYHTSQFGDVSHLIYTRRERYNLIGAKYFVSNPALNCRDTLLNQPTSHPEAHRDLTHRSVVRKHRIKRWAVNNHHTTTLPQTQQQKYKQIQAAPSESIIL